MTTGFRIALLLASIVVPLLSCTAAPQSDVAILVDTVHSHEGHPGFRFKPEEFRYDHAHTTRRLMEQLSDNGFSYTIFKEGQLTPELLKQFDILFMNVTTTALAPIGEQEKQAIWDFVAGGGSLFWVYEHTNYYGNAMTSDPVMAKFGIQAMYGTANEEPYSRYASADNGHWVVVRSFSQHPINRGLEAISFYSGCAFETRHGTAFLSQDGWVDLGDDHIEDVRNRQWDPGEPRGALPVVAATDFEKGRVVAVGDHNLIGAQWYGVADNRRWVLNAFEWLARREGAAARLGDTRAPGLQVGFDLEHSKWNIGSRNKDGFHAFHAGFGRNEKIFAHGMTSLDSEHDVLVFTDPVLRFTPAELEIVADHLAQGRSVLLVADVEAPGLGSRQLLNRFAPQLRFETPSGSLAVSNLGAPGKLTRINGSYFPIESPLFDTDGLKVAALSHPGLTHQRFPGRISRFVERAVPYLLDVRLDAGEALLSAIVEDGRRVTIGRRIPAGKGTLVLIVQGRIWMNNTLGFFNEAPTKENRSAHKLQDRFVQWLVDSQD